MGSRSNHSAPKSYGAPLSTPKPGGTTRKRPKVGDKDPDYKPRKPRKKTPRKPAEKKKPELNYNHRDYRGTRGAIDDAEGVKRKDK